MKTKTILIAALMFLGLSAAAYAQALFDVGSEIIPTVIESGCTEKVGNILFTTDKSTGPTVTGTITIDYGNPINDQGQIVVTPDPDDTGALPVIQIVDFTAGDQELILSITPQAGGALYYGFRVEGIRVQIAGAPDATPLQVYISSQGNGISTNEEDPYVVHGQAPGLGSFGYLSPLDAPYKINAVTGQIVSGDGVTLDLEEGFRAAFGVTVATDPTQNNTQQVKIALDHAVPDGVTICFDTVTNDGHWTIIGPNCLVGPTISSAPYVVYGISSDTSLTAVEDLLTDVTVTAEYNEEAAYPLITISARATLFPDCYNMNAIPRYLATWTDSVPIVSFVPASTTLMIPFATTALGLDTAVGVANTTIDPTEDVMNFLGALPQDGSITFYFYPQIGAPFHYHTSATSPPIAGDGVINPLEDGELPAGRTYTVFVSELLAAAGHPLMEFTGYIIIQCNFTNAHGQYYVTNWEFFTNGAQALVLNSGWIPIFMDGPDGMEGPGRLYGTEGVNH